MFPPNPREILPPQTRVFPLRNSRCNPWKPSYQTEGDAEVLQCEALLNPKNMEQTSDFNFADKWSCGSICQTGNRADSLERGRRKACVYVAGATRQLCQAAAQRKYQAERGASSHAWTTFIPPDGPKAHRGAQPPSNSKTATQRYPLSSDRKAAEEPIW